MVRVAIVLLMLLLPSVAWAQGEKRIALLIGNQDYKASVGSLKNPHNDIELVASALKHVGFEVLPLVKDARRSAMLGAVRGLVARLNAVGAGAVGFLYYSGHGAAESATGVNYLIPIDATDTDTAEFWDQSLKLDDVLKLMENATQAAHFVVFDACRNELKLSQKSTSKGFIPVAEQTGMFIAYASAPGRPASDVGAKSGPYAAALATELVKTGQHHLDLFQNVKEAVGNASAGKQEPWERNGLRRRVYFAGTQTPPPAPVQSARLSEAAEAWGAVKDSRSVVALEAYVVRYKDTFYAELARQRMEELKKQQIALSPAQLDRSELERAAAFIRETEDQARLETFIKQFGDSPYAEMARTRLQELRKKQAAVATPPKAPAPMAAKQKYSIDTNRALYGRGIASLNLPTLDACREACDLKIECVAFELGTASTCRLFEALTSRQRLSGFVSGVRETYSEARTPSTSTMETARIRYDYDINAGRAIFGILLLTVNTDDLHQCRVECDRAGGCVAFEVASTCRLFKEVSSSAALSGFTSGKRKK
jgi:uncharacterized caspase-like protein